MTATIYRWDDPGAPQLAPGDAPGNLINVLDKVLISGYGDKLPAGWTKPFANVADTIAVYRNNAVTGTGFFWRVDDSGDVWDDNNAAINGYETMADVDTGNAPFPDPAQIEAVLVRKTKWKTTSGPSYQTAINPWVIVADDLTCYIFTFTHSTEEAALERGAQTTMIGDFISYIDGDAYNAITAGSPRFATYTYGYSYNGLFMMAYDPSTWSANYLARNGAADAGAIRVIMFPATINKYIVGWHTTSYNISTATNSNIEHPHHGVTVYQRVLVADDDYINAMKTLRGILPGILDPLHMRPFDNLAEDEAGRLMIQILGYSSSGDNSTDGMLAIDIDNFRNVT